MYIGTTKVTFENRFYQYKHSFINVTTLSGYLWFLRKTSLGEFKIVRLALIKHNHTEKAASNQKCDVTFERNIKNMFQGSNSLNKRTEMLALCIHGVKQILCKYYFDFVRRKNIDFKAFKGKCF